MTLKRIQQLTAENAALKAELANANDSKNWYQRRVDLMQKHQSKMRDPERVLVCDILANGMLLDPSGDRYELKAQEPVAWMNPYGGVLTRLSTGLERETYTIPLFTAPQPAAVPADNAEYQRGIADAINRVDEIRASLCEIYDDNIKNKCSPMRGNLDWIRIEATARVGISLGVLFEAP